jgi:hypothetical protein
MLQSYGQSRLPPETNDLLGDTIHEETPHAVVAVVDSDVVPGLVQLIGTC